MNTWSHIQLWLRASRSAIALGLAIAWLVVFEARAQSIDLDGITVVDASTGEERSFKDFEGKGTVAVIFFCNDCPYTAFYVDRINGLSRQYSEVQFVLVNSFPVNSNPEEALEKMAAYHKSNRLAMPYVADNEQKLLKKLGARKCPEAVVLASSGGNWTKVYNGAIDNNPQVASDVTASYLSNVLTNVSGYKGPPTHRPIGCNIKRM